jgi:hypothetical protein
MATPQEYVQSVLSSLALVQDASEELLATEGVVEILKDMDALATDLYEVLG